MRSNYIITVVLLLVLAFMNACKNKDIETDSFKMREDAFPSANSVTFRGSYSFSGNVDGITVNIGERDDLLDARSYKMQIEGTDFSATVDSLKSSTKYFYNYTIDFGAGNTCIFPAEEVKWFYTARVPKVRIVNVLVTDNDSTSIRVDCVVGDQNGSEVTERGICWNTFGNPNIGDNTLQDTIGGLGPYSIKMEHLASGKTYYILAYAKNAAGTGYSPLPPQSFDTPTSTEEHFNIEVNWYPENGGSVTGGGTFHYGDTAKLEVEANDGYQFESWDDGNTENPRMVIVTGDATYTAIFIETSAVYYVVTTHADPEEGGRVEGGGTYVEGEEIRLSANANDGYEFIRWDDGNENNPRTIRVDDDMEFTAIFKKKTYTVTVHANDGGTVHIDDMTGTTATFEHGDICWVHAIPNPGYVFKNWMENEAEVSTDADYNFTVTSNRNLVAHFTTSINTISVMFTVTLQDGNSPVGTTICFLNLNTQEPLYFSLNDETGVFRQNVPAENYQITVAKTGYVSIIKEYDLSNVIDEISLGEFPLEPNYEYVDLGLPSGTLWATRNVGAETPEGYGDYFAWGETQPKSNYVVSNYQHFHGRLDNITKYCNNPSCGYNGFTDNLTILPSMEDGATTHLGWGNALRITTNEEWEELYQYTTPSWTNLNGVYGYQFTARNNDNYIFLPAAGYQYSNNPSNIGTLGYYWSSSLYLEDPNRSWHFSFISGICDVYNNLYRYNGMSVRPVRSAQ